MKTIIVDILDIELFKENLKIMSCFENVPRTTLRMNAYGDGARLTLEGDVDWIRSGVERLEEIYPGQVRY